jgi:hypothetical protein
MIEYSVDTNPRIRIYFGLAALSLAGAWALSVIPQIATHKYAAPSAFAIFGTLLWLFDRYLWRLPAIRSLVGIPYLGGDWPGTLAVIESENESEKGERNVKLSVTQTWRQIDFVLHGGHRISNTRIAGLFVGNPNHIEIMYVYAVKAHELGVPNRAGEGATVLYFERCSDGDHLNGTYYSDKRNCGNLKLRRLSPPFRALDENL